MSIPILYALLDVIWVDMEVRLRERPLLFFFLLLSFLSSFLFRLGALLQLLVKLLLELVVRFGLGRTSFHCIFEELDVSICIYLIVHAHSSNLSFLSM